MGKVALADRSRVKSMKTKGTRISTPVVGVGFFGLVDLEEDKVERGRQEKSPTGFWGKSDAFELVLYVGSEIERGSEGLNDS